MVRVRDINEDRPWSEADNDDLRHEVRRGESVDYIAVYMCRRPDEILAQARALDLPLKPPRQKT